jgi:hypothetical protein
MQEAATAEKLHKQHFLAAATGGAAVNMPAAVCMLPGAMDIM